MVPDEMQKMVPPKMRKVELRELAVLAGVVVRKLDARNLDIRGANVRGPKLSLAGRLAIAARYVLPCAFCLEEFDNDSDCARWPGLDDGIRGNQTGNVNPGGLDCSER